MRRVVVGTDASGRSMVVHDGAPPAAYRFAEPRAGAVAPTPDARPPSAGEIVMETLWAADPVPDPTVVEAVDGDAPLRIDCAPGAMRWHIVNFGPHRTTPLHRTNTLDCNVVLAGEVELVLEEGSALLSAGDALVMPGVVHGWRTGDHGATMAVLQTGLRAVPSD